MDGKLKNDLERRMAEAFSTYDFVCTNTIANENVVNVLRFLGCAPCDKDVQEFCRLCEYEDIKGSIHLSRFMVTLNDWLLLERMKPATLNELLDAFGVLDPATKGYMTTDELLAYTHAYGDTFTETEEHEMLVAAADKDKIIFYEPYVYKLWYKTKTCIYKQATELAAMK